MANIFVSYGSDDRARVRTLAMFLADNGHEVWWDRELIAGTDFADEIDRQLKKADIIIVCWSARSVASNWVKSEANEGMRTDRLLPITLDGTPGPRPFDQITTLDVSKWSDDNGAQLLKAVGDLPRHPAMSAFKKARQRTRLRTGLGVACAAVVLAVLWGPIASVIPSPTANAVTAYEKPRISEAAIRHILRRLEDTGRPTREAAVALIQTQNVHDAIRLLDSNYNQLLPDTPKKDEIALLHQIGALAFDYNPAKARGYFDNLLVLAPTDTLALELLGELLRDSGDMKAAETLFKRALESAEALPEARQLHLEVLLSQLKLHQGEFDAAVEAADTLTMKAEALGAQEQVVSALRFGARAHFMKGFVKPEGDHFLLAQNRIDRVITIQKQGGEEADLASAWLTKGLITRGQGHNAEAMEYYQTSLKIAQDLELPLHINLAITSIAALETDLGNYDAAERYYRRAINYSVDHGLTHVQGGLWLGLARLAKKRGDTQDLVCQHYSRARAALGTEFNLTLKETIRELGCG